MPNYLLSPRTVVKVMKWILSAPWLPIVGVFAPSPIVCSAFVAEATKVAQPHNGDANPFDEAAGLIQEGKIEEALTKLDSVPLTQTTQPFLSYFRGVAYLELGQPRKALRYFEEGLEALAAMTRIQDPSVVPSDWDELRRLLADAHEQALHELSNFGLSLRMGLAYDSNVTFRGGGPTGVLIAGRGDGLFATELAMGYALINDADQKLAWMIRASDSWHFSIGEFNYQDYATSLLYTRKLNSSWELDLWGVCDLSYLDNQPLQATQSIAPGIRYRWPVPDEVRVLAAEETFLEYRLGWVEYLASTSPELDRDGLANSIRLEQSLLLDPLQKGDWRCRLTAGYRWGSVSTEGAEYDRQFHLFDLRLAVPIQNPMLPHKEARLELLGGGLINDYRNRSQFDRYGGDRSELIMTAGLVFSQQVLEDAERGELWLHGLVFWNNSDSNVDTREGLDPFRYEKVLVGIQIEWRF